MLLLLFLGVVVAAAVAVLSIGSCCRCVFWMIVRGLNVKCLWLCSGIVLVVVIAVVFVVVLDAVVVVTVVGSIGTCFHAVGKYIYVLFILHYVFF